MNLKYEIDEEEPVTEKQERWTGKVNDYEISVSREVTFGANDAGAHEIHILPPLRSGIGSLFLHPDSVAALERLARELPSVLLALAEGLRAQGKDDLRSTLERRYDKF